MSDINLRKAIQNVAVRYKGSAIPDQIRLSNALQSIVDETISLDEEDEKDHNRIINEINPHGQGL